jgi:3-hydroxybutyryl-CoA dehydrogenase
MASAKTGGKTMQLKDINRILVVGGGTMGRQIAFQCAMHGYQVAIYDVEPGALEAAINQVEQFAALLEKEGRLTEDQVAATLDRIRTSADPAQAAEGADLLSESIPEISKLKGQVLNQFNSLCPPETIFTTNSSTLVPSQFAKASGRPHKLCALHFHQPIWEANVVDIMPHPGTSPEIVKLLESFARSIDQIPIILKRESPSYVFNAMLDGVLSAALSLAGEEVASIEDIDRAWMGVTQMSIGPFGIIDAVGIDLVLEIVIQKTKRAAFVPEVKRLRALLADKVDQGHLGRKSGQGFYSYPNPAFEVPGFLKGTMATESESTDQGNFE